MEHKFEIGQLVRPRTRLLENAGIYEILRPLPRGPDGEPLYRIRAASGPIERVVRETDLVPASGPTADTGQACRPLPSSPDPSCRTTPVQPTGGSCEPWDGANEERAGPLPSRLPSRSSEIR